MCLYYAAAAVNEYHSTTEVEAISDRSLLLKDEPLTLSLFAQRHAHLLKQGFTILESFAGLTQAPQRIRHALNQPDSFDSTTLRDLEDFILSTLSRKDALKEEYAHRL